jgi:hypothetical protein
VRVSGLQRRKLAGIGMGYMLKIERLGDVGFQKSGCKKSKIKVSAYCPLIFELKGKDCRKGLHVRVSLW